MAIKRKKKPAQDYGKMAMDLGLGLAGGIVANQASNFLEKQDFMQGNEELTPLIPAALGAIGYVFLPPQFKAAAFGMFVVSGTEAGEGLIAQATGTVNGVLNQLGFTPQYLPSQAMRDARIKTPQGVVVR